MAGEENSGVTFDTDLVVTDDGGDDGGSGDSSGGEREAEIRAAKEAVEAVKDEAVSEAKERSPEEKLRSKEQKGEKEQVAKEVLSKSELKKALAAREETARARQAASQEAELIKREVSQAQYEIQQQRRQLQRERESLLKLRSNPAEAIRELGMDPEDFIMNLAQAGSPEDKLQRRLKEQDEAIQRLHRERQYELRQQQEAQQRYQEAQQAQFRESVTSEFVNIAMSEEHPLTRDFYQGTEKILIAWADQIADEYRDLTGKEATSKEVAEYIEEQLQARYHKSSAGNKRASGQGKATQSAKPAFSVSGRDASDKRALKRTFTDMDEEERSLAAREAAQAAIAAYSRE